MRFSIIDSLLDRQPKKGDLYKELKCLASCHYPSSNQRLVGEIWDLKLSNDGTTHQALRSADPIQVLGRKVPSDAGHPTAMSPQLLNLLRKQYEDYPNWSYRLHADNLAALVAKQMELGKAPSYSTIMRRMKQRRWYKKQDTHRPQSPGQKQAQQWLEKRKV